MNVIKKRVVNFILHKIFNCLYAQVYWTDKNKTFVGCNKRYCEFLKIKDQKVLLNRNITQLEDEYKLHFEIQNVCRTQNELVFEKKYINNLSTQYFRVTEYFFLDLTISIEENVTNFTQRIDQLTVEINELKIKEEQTNAYLNNVIRIVPASIYWKDRDFIIRGSNLFHSKLAGFSDPQEVIGKTEYDFVWKDQAAEIIENDKKIMALGKGVRLEENASLSDGTVHTFLTSKEPLRDKNNQIIGIIGISIDITEQKKSEDRTHKAEAMALLAKSKSDSETETRKLLMILVGDIVHDLRTPIATLRSIGVLLSNIFPDVIAVIDEANELGSQKIKLLTKRKLNALHDNTLVNSINNSVKMMDEFINSTLKELSYAQKGLQSEVSLEELTKCSSRRILENTLDAYPLDQTILLHTNTSYDFYLMGNSILIMKILFNLIRNAVDQIIINGKGEIYIETCEEEVVNQLKIKDTAGGTSPDILSKMFDGYFTTKKDGTGLGLASCKKMMERFGGSLTVDNIYGEYIEFILSFPKISD